MGMSGRSWEPAIASRRAGAGNDRGIEAAAGLVSWYTARDVLVVAEGTQRPTDSDS